MVNVEKYGFSLMRERDLSEIDARLYEFEHIKTGASLVYLERDDENKTFSIGFPTPPKDDTGVFHIIEHSVLCGSEKYPLNDPFAELLKGSLNTFLNAMTYEDRTVYPVSSRCEKDFLNLTDVYLDAVFSPNLLKNPSIFRQEGWHYEYDEENNELSINGVVYNEMKGAYSSADELAEVNLSRALFSGTPYSYDSGGAPVSIPNLSYEEIKAVHRRHYHPSNAKIILDGRMDLAPVLSLIDAHLSKYERVEPLSILSKSTPRVAPLTRVKYEIAEGEDEKGKARLLLGYVYSDYTDREMSLAMSILSDILCGSNASPLKKSLLESGLCKDAAVYSIKSHEHTVVVEVRDIDENRQEEIVALVDNTIRSIAKGGIEESKIKATLNSIEFRLRERDFGTIPTGVAFAMSMYGSWFYGDLPENAILYNDAISSIKSKIGSGYFEKALLKITEDNPHRAKVLMLPDKQLGKRQAEEEKERLKGILDSMSKADLNKIKLEEKELREWQDREPSVQELSSLPTLSLEDIPSKISRPSSEEKTLNGVKIVKCPTKTNGIVYISLLFDASDLCKEQLLRISMLSSALLNFPTKNYSPLELQNEAKANLGSLFCSIATGSRNRVTTPYLKVGASALTSKTHDMVRLIKELLLTSRIEDKNEVGKIVVQMKNHLEDILISAGESVALLRAEASLSEDGAVADYMTGYEAYKILSELCQSEKKLEKFTKELADLLTLLVDRRRLTIFVTGDASEELLTSIISIFPEGNGVSDKKRTPPCADKNEFVLIPSKVAYAVIGGKSDEVNKNLGLMRVTRSILSYEYLWNSIRVQGGAYGAGFVAKKDGTISFYSYRDPNPSRSLKSYPESCDYLRGLADRGEDLTKFIIGAMGEYDTLITPRTASLISITDYLGGWSAEEEEGVRAQMLNVKAEDLRRAADIIEAAISDPSIAVVGNRDHLNSLDNEKMTVIKI